MNWITLIVGLVALFIGYKLNQYANQQSEKRIIDTLTAEIESLKNKQATGRITPQEQTRIAGLEEAINILQNK